MWIKAAKKFTVSVMLMSYVAEHRAEGGAGKLEAGAPGETATSG